MDLDNLNVDTKSLDNADITMQTIADPREIAFHNKLGTAISKIFDAIKGIKIPDLMEVFGKVDVGKVDSLPPVRINNLDELGKLIQETNQKFVALTQAVSNIPQPKVEFPKIEFPKNNQTQADLSPITKAISSLEETISNSKPEINIPKTVEISNWPPTYTPPAVTKIDINPLRGGIISTGVSVGSTLTALPPTTAPRRRAIMVFNNHATAILYIGNQNITSSFGAYQGLPVLAQTYSPVMDLGPQITLYGISASATIQTIVCELEADYGTSSTSVGNV